MNKNFYHGIMFHYFHGNKTHKKSQGSIDKDQLSNIIKKIGRKNILNADEFFYRHLEKKLKSNNVCFTFDDGLKSQFDIALPILQDYKIKSFFFINTINYTDNKNYIELFRFFRNNFFKSINEYYKEFFSYIDKDLNSFFKKELSTLKKLKQKFPYYSINDLKFRITRDSLLTKSEYIKICFKMFDSKKFSYKKHLNKLYLSKKELVQISKLGHLIGLHSHSHHHKIESLKLEDQIKEYKKNLYLLEKILNKRKNEINYMSHPNGSYTTGTLKILNKLGIKLGFKQIMTIEKDKGMKKINNSPLEIARKPHNEILSC